jgi:hypothetical protein
MMPLNRFGPMAVEPSMPLPQNVFAMDRKRASTTAIQADLSRRMLGPNNFGHNRELQKNCFCMKEW